MVQLVTYHMHSKLVDLLMAGVEVLFPGGFGLRPQCKEKRLTVSWKDNCWYALTPRGIAEAIYDLREIVAKYENDMNDLTKTREAHP